MLGESQRQTLPLAKPEAASVSPTSGPAPSSATLQRPIGRLLLFYIYHLFNWIPRFRAFLSGDTSSPGEMLHDDVTHARMHARTHAEA